MAGGRFGDSHLDEPEEPGYDAELTAGRVASDTAVSATAHAPTASISEWAEQSPLGIALVTGEACRISYVNPAFRRLTRSESQLVLEQPLAGAFPSWGDVPRQLRELSNAGELRAGPGRELTVAGGSGVAGAAGATTLLLIAWPVSTASKELELTLVIQIREAPDNRHDEARRERMDEEMREVNQRLVIASFQEQELTARAEAASEAKSAFLATMSHELRTPLNAIIGYASLLDEEIWGPVLEEQHRHLARISASARHLLGLIDEVLTLARMDADREMIYRESVNSDVLLDEVSTLTMPLAVTKQLSFDIEPPDQPFVIATDHGKVLQILVNLIGNAVKFTDSGGITLCACIENDEARFTVRDTGIGIGPASMEHIFDAFWQVEQTRTRRVGGTGLGLRLSRRLAQLLGGDVTVKSTLGEGSAFTLCLPLHANERDSADGRDESSPG